MTIGIRHASIITSTTNGSKLLSTKSSVGSHVVEQTKVASSTPETSPIALLMLVVTLVLLELFLVVQMKLHNSC